MNNKNGQKLKEQSRLLQPFINNFEFVFVSFSIGEFSVVVFFRNASEVSVLSSRDLSERRRSLARWWKASSSSQTGIILLFTIII